MPHYRIIGKPDDTRHVLVSYFTDAIPERKHDTSSAERFAGIWHNVYIGAARGGKELHQVLQRAAPRRDLEQLELTKLGQPDPAAETLALAESLMDQVFSFDAVVEETPEEITPADVERLLAKFKTRVVT